MPEGDAALFPLPATTRSSAGRNTEHRHRAGHCGGSVTVRKELPLLDVLQSCLPSPLGLLCRQLVNPYSLGCLALVKRSYKIQTVVGWLVVFSCFRLLWADWGWRGKKTPEVKL